MPVNPYLDQFSGKLQTSLGTPPPAPRVPGNVPYRSGPAPAMSVTPIPPMTDISREHIEPPQGFQLPTPAMLQNTATSARPDRGMAMPPPPPPSQDDGGVPIEEGAPRLTMPGFEPPRYVTTKGYWNKYLDPLQASTRKSQDDALEARGEAAKAHASISADEHIQNAMVYDQVSKDLQQQMRDQEAEHARQKAAEDEQRALAQETISAVETNKIDPNRLFADRNTGFKILALIGGALGGYTGVANRTGRNSFNESLDRMIDRDIRAQEVALETGKWKAGQAQNMLAQLERNGMNRAMAKQTLRASYLAHVDANLAAIRSRTGTRQSLATIDDISADVKTSKAQAQAQADALTHVNPQRVQVGGGNFTPLSREDEAQMVDLGPGMAVRFNRPDMAKEFEKKKIATKNITDIINEGLKIRSQASDVDLANPKSAVSKKLAGLQATLDTKVTVYEEQGAMSKGDRQVATEASGSMGGFMKNNDDVLRQKMNILHGSLKNQASEASGQIVQTGFMRDPKTGRNVRGYAYTGQQNNPAPTQGSSKFKPAGK